MLLSILNIKLGRARLKCDGTPAETRCGLSMERTSLFKLAWGGVSVQSTTGSRHVRISSSNGSNANTPCSDVECKTAGYPLDSHVSPSLPLPCVVCHHISTELYFYCNLLLLHDTKVNGRAIPLQAWTGPEGSRCMRLPHFKTTGIQRW